MAKNSKNQTDELLDKDKKLEILGLICIALSLLIGLSILTYNKADFAVISHSGFSDLLSSDSTGRAVKNALGPVGAYLSHFFVYILFGYFSIIFSVLGVMYGWSLLKHNDLVLLHKKAVFYSLLMFVLASVFGWLRVVSEDGISEAWAGSVGIGVSNVLVGLIATWGAAIVLITALIAVLLVVVGGSIQEALEKSESGISGFVAKFATWNQDRKEKARERAEAYRQQREAQLKKSQQDANEKPTLQQKPHRAQPPVLAPEPEPEPEESPEERRIRLRKEEEAELANRRPRAIIETIPEKPSTSDNDPEITVYKGAGEEEASDDDLKRQQSEIAGKKVIKYRFPGIELLDPPSNEGNEIDMEEIRHNKEIILDKLGRHNIEILSIEAVVGPTVTLYELEPAPDVKISKIESYANDLKMAMATHGLRIIAPIPGKSAVGIEVPNRKRETVYIKQVINTKKFVDTDMTLPVAFGKTIENEVFMVDLAKLPHVLMAGATGAGKSVGINTVITCLLFKCHPDNLKFVLIDPKKIELALYRNIQNHYLATLPDLDEPIITDTSRVLEVLNSVCKEMDDRYDLLKMAMVRDIKAYNDKFSKKELEEDLGHRHLPYIVVIIDEMADLMITAGKGIEEPIARIAQLARAVGIHLVVATQRPSVNVITGTIKANFPARIAYRVASKVDSRTILDTIGADQLVGRGDMLFTGGSGMIRVQNAFVSTEEVERINAFIGSQLGYNSPFYLPKIEEESNNAPGVLDKSERDELFEEAAKVVILHQQGSVSLLQRKLKLGYNRAGRIVDQLFMAGIVGPYQGSTAREVLIQTEDELQELLNELDS